MTNGKLYVRCKVCAAMFGLFRWMGQIDFATDESEILDFMNEHMIRCYGGPYYMKGDLFELVGEEDR